MGPCGSGRTLVFLIIAIVIAILFASIANNPAAE